MRHYQEITTTHHMVDDVCLTAAEAMGLFCKQFALPDPDVHAHGKIITFKLKHPRHAASWERIAQQIINQWNLPLEANLEKWEKKGVVFEQNLCIEYKPD